MKKYFTLAVFICLLITIYNCNPSRKISANTSTGAAAPKVNYESHIKEVIAANCSPCHIPSKGGFKKAFDNFANVKSDINEMIRRIELSSNEKGFMPFKKAKLSDSTIAIFKQWREEGLLEK